MQRAQRPEILGRARRLARDVVESLVLQDAGAGHVLGLRLAFAPGRKLHEHGKRLRRLDAHLEAPPGMLGMKLVGGGVGQHGHLFVEPARPLRPIKLRFELGVEFAQIGDVAERVGELALGERAAAPIGEA